MAEPTMFKLLERSQIGLAAPSSRDPHRTSTTLPLTFLDINLAGPIYVRRLYFYQFPSPTHHFMETTLPNLKSSLSLTLQHFYPLAGNLLCPPPPEKPFVHCTGNDSVALTVLQSAADFKQLISNNPKHIKDLDCLVPELPYSMDDDETFIFPLLAFQITVFPNHGLCIGITYCHVMDDRSCGHFMKSWASICGKNGDMTFVENSPPLYDRKMIKDHEGLEAIFLRDNFTERSSWKDSIVVGQNSSKGQDNCGDPVKATLKLSRKDIEELKKWVLNNGECQNAPHLSKFVVACALVWINLVKTRYKDDDEEDEEKEEYFIFAAECRNRLEYSIPATYFGNCITRIHIILKRKDLKGKDGFVKAVKAIGGAIAEMKKEPFEGAEKWRENFFTMFILGNPVLVTGSPNFTVYETDFGFGRPVKVDMVHSIKGMSLAESGDEEGGLEFGLVFKSEDEFQYFISAIEQGLGTLKC